MDSDSSSLNGDGQEYNYYIAAMLLPDICAVRAGWVSNGF